MPYTPFLGLIKSSVTLLRVDESGNLVATLGTMCDDGTHGDAQPGDANTLDSSPSTRPLRDRFS